MNASFSGLMAIASASDFLSAILHYASAFPSQILHLISNKLSEKCIDLGSGLHSFSTKPGYDGPLLRRVTIDLKIANYVASNLKSETWCCFSKLSADGAASLYLVQYESPVRLSAVYPLGVPKNRRCPGNRPNIED